MDELVIGDKVYVSSKKAAKLTGYAKDYVGQLCREGKVEARLVGRNWYVLEGSILAHRFGETEVVPATEQRSIKPESLVDAGQWPQSVYTPESVDSLPQMNSFKRDSDINKDSVGDVRGSGSVADIQQAWKEWYEEREFSAEEYENQYVPAPGYESNEVDSSFSSETHYYSDIPQEDPTTVPLHRLSDAEKIQKTHNVIDTTSEEPIHVNYGQTRPSFERGNDVKSSPTTTRRGRNTRKGVKRRLLSVILLCILALLIVTTYSSVRSISNSEKGQGNTFIDYINGVRTIE